MENTAERGWPADLKDMTTWLHDLKYARKRLIGQIKTFVRLLDRWFSDIQLDGDFQVFFPAELKKH